MNMDKQARLFFSVILIAVIAVLALISFFMEQQLQTWMRDRISAELLQDAQTINSAIQHIDPDFSLNSLDPIIDDLTRTSNHRVTLIDVSGTVLADSQLTISSIRKVENHKKRKELVTATKDAPGIAIRYSNTVKQDMMYLAIPYTHSGNIGHIRVSISLAVLDQYVQHLRKIQMTVAIIAFISLTILLFIALRFISRINNINKERLNQKVISKTNDLVKIQKFSHILACCQESSELSLVVSKSALSIFPKSNGALFITQPSKDKNEVIAIWGEQWLGDDIYNISDCWALRRSATYTVFDHQQDIICKHLSKHDSAATICIPLLAHSVTLGALHIVFNKEPSQSVQSLFKTMADHLSLTLSNLNLRESLKLQAIRDPLTNLYNRRYLDETLQNEILKAKRHNHSIGILMIDIDHFKKFNDSFGHDVGDHVLKLVSSALNKIIRDEDLACRFGGEEFIIVMPDTDLATIEDRAQCLLKLTRKLDLVYKKRPISQITLSIGVAVYPANGGDAAACIRAADTALYVAKSEGRDRYIVSH